MNRTRIFLLALGSLLLTSFSEAQYELKVGNFNNVFVAQNAAGAAATAFGPPSPANPPPAAGQFAAVGQVAGSSSPLDATPNDALAPGTISPVFADQYPSTSDNALVLKRSTIGSSFTSGIPRYFMGDIITPPSVQVDGVTFADSSYWRVQPVLPGESLLSVELPVAVLTASGNTVTVDLVPSSLVVGSTMLGRAVSSISGTTLTLSGSVSQTISETTLVNYISPDPQVLLPLGTVTVSDAETNRTTVTVDSIPAELKVGAILLGQPITKIEGVGPATVTLAGNPNATISFATPVSITPALAFYYSPHAEQVFASQPGRVTITWVTRVPASGDSYGVKSEVFAVSSNTQKTVRTIFWTEGSFDGPTVHVTDGRITTVNPVYNTSVPKAVGAEVSIPGYNPITPDLSTLSFDKFNGIGQISAYNVEGRILVEYLGNVRLAGNIYEFIGSDVVDIKRVPTINNVPVSLGSQLTPSIAAPDDEAPYVPSPVLANIQDAASFYGTVTQPDGTLVYYAERETSVANDPDNGEPASPDAYNKVVFYWLKTGTFGIQWPIFQDRYWQRWSPFLDDYAHYTVVKEGSTPETGVAFSGGLLPEIIYQDDPTQTEAQIDLATQRFFVDFANGNESNLSLLKFTTSDDVWYVNVYTQAEDRETTLQSTSSTPTTSPTFVTVPSTENLTVGMEVTGPGITGTATILSISNETQYELSQNVADATATFYYIVGVTNTSVSTPADLLITIPSTVGYENITYADAPVGDYITAVVSPTELSYLGGYYDVDGTYDIQFYLDNFNGDSPFVTSEVTFTATGPTSFRVFGAALSQPLEVGMQISGPGIEGFATITELDDAVSGTLDFPPTPADYGLYTYSRELVSTTNTEFPATKVTVPSTVGLEVGMIVSGAGFSDVLKIAAIISDTEYLLSDYIPDGFNEFTYTVESDDLSPINTTASVGTRLTPPAGHELAGYIASGTGYYPQGYLDPFVVGIEAAKQGAIIPVNALPDDRVLTVHWFKKFNLNKPSAAFQDLYVPGKIGRYTVGYPDDADQIVIAEGIGTGDLSPAEAAGFVYTQNVSTLPGYNPNEEHAPSILGGRAYALRDDLNVTSGANYTSEPFLLLAYTDPSDNRPAIHAFEVVRENEDYTFDYTATAGTALIKPYPLPLLPLPLVGTGVNRTSKDIEIVGADDPANTNNLVATNPAYTGFTFKDRTGNTYIHRGPHDGGSPTLTMKLYYLSQAGFYLPGAGGEAPVDTVLPFLRDAARSGESLNLNAIDDGQTDQPLEIVYTPVWPDDAPELRVAETLTLAKFGLPQVRGQASAEILYQQSIAQDTVTNDLSKNSVTLHDPTREKTAELDTAGITLDAIPESIKTTSYQGKVYFQNLPPHLQQRFYFDPLRGDKGTLILIGIFNDVLAGEDYLDLNMLSVADALALKSLVPDGNSDESNWDAAINALNTAVETFIPDPAQFGSYIVGSSVNRGGDELAIIRDPDTAVDSYAITATGQGTGYVTMVFGNGGNPDQQPQGDPVQVQVFKIADELYVGDLKVVLSSNPLDEQVSLRHSGDFAGKPEDYEFEWRWATGEASAPATYAFTMERQIGDPGLTDDWFVVSDPGALTPTAEQYTSGGFAVPFPRSVNVRPASYTDAEIAAGYPSVVIKSESGVDFTSGVPGSIVLSAVLGSYDGFVLYVNNRVAAAFNAPTPQFSLTNSSSGLTELGQSAQGGNDALKQFNIAPSYFTAGVNTVELAIYTTADLNASSALDFVLEAAEETDLVDVAVTPGTKWQIPTSGDTNLAIIGGEGNPFSGPAFVLNDRWFTMRYKPTADADNVLGEQYSRWMPPQFVPGWVKRVLSAINPFQQRVTDLFNNEINSDVSVLTQAGQRWEGDIALTLDNIDDVGLIEIYETVLNRAKSFSIDANTNDPDTNNALLLAAGYLSDLYTILGNEAFADAANPTISIDDQASAAEVNTSRFSFEAQVASSLDEELALLRGRDDFVSPGVETAPAYNRLYWNYTGGINSGEVLYAVNYNIKEKVGSDDADGVIDEFDAARMFPQGHGDAYGHYLTALTGYYSLLANNNFDWKPRAEAMTVAGQAVTVDFQDERKFAAAAGNIARTAEQVVSLTYRQSYQDDPSQGWASYRDSTGTNSSTGVTRRQGLDEWVSRSTQGALYNWAVANALVPDEDTYHTGVQKIDRSTVLEIPQLASYAASFQTTIDNANARLNPLGLSADAIAFDISPSEMKAGNTHYEQIYARSLRTLNNAAGAFNQAAVMTRSLRDQENQVDDYITTIAQQESAYVDELIDIYGRPYSGDIGAGKTFAQGYAGPDLINWFIVDRPNGLADTSAVFDITIQSPQQYDEYTGNSIADLLKTLDPYTANQTVRVSPSSFVQYNDTWQSGGLGSRAETGALQDALLDAQQTYLALADISGTYRDTATSLRRAISVFDDMINTHIISELALASTSERISSLEKVVLALDSAADGLEFAASFNDDTADSIAEFFPRSVGFSTDATSGARGAAKLSGAVAAQIARGLAVASRIGAGVTSIAILDTEQSLEQSLQSLDFNFEEVQMAYEIDNLYREHIGHGEELMQLTLNHQRALQQVRNVAAKGNRVLADREIFRQRAAAIIQGYRTKDLTFRLFRNEALEQYRTLFDLASRYTYLAAKSYDYETGLLGTVQGQDVFNQIVASRSLGDLSGGVPQSTTSTLGDSGLAGTMAQLNADFTVAEGRLGLNNPDQYGTIFSLRNELFRLLDVDPLSVDDAAWQQILQLHIVPDLMADADVAAMCMNLKKSDGSPVPGILITFSTTIQSGKNFFGRDLAAGDHAYSVSNFATKIYNVGVALPGYVGMDTYASGDTNGAPASGDAYALSATPYLYLIPAGNDYMRAPALGDTDSVRSWTVNDQALPLPYNLGATDFNSNQFFSANGTLSEQPWITRKHQAFRPVTDPTLFYSSVPEEFTNSRLIGRSVWNGQWKLVIPANTLLNNEQQGLDNFTATVKDIQLFLRTYSNSGN